LTENQSLSQREYWWKS